jgi:hypothetical protein
MVFLTKVKKKIYPQDNISRKEHEPMTRKMRQDYAEAGQGLFSKNLYPWTRMFHVIDTPWREKSAKKKGQWK